MHFRSSANIVLALLFSPNPPSFAAFFEREFWPSGCFGGGRHSPLPVCQLMKGHEGCQI